MSMLHLNISFKVRSGPGVFLFNLYLNDLPDIFDNTCTPAVLYKEHINCLLFADDLILISQTEEGLQNCLSKLNEYCEKWILKINTDKTKIIIFNKSGKILKHNDFKVGSTNLEVVSSHVYLGILFSVHGSFGPAIEHLAQKARKATFKLTGAINDSNIKCSDSLKIYDSLIRPITLYGSDVWGPFVNKITGILNTNNDFRLLDKLPFEKIDIKFCKYILKTHKKSVNAAVRGELGRYPILGHIIKKHH